MYGRKSKDGSFPMWPGSQGNEFEIYPIVLCCALLQMDCVMYHRANGLMTMSN